MLSKYEVSPFSLSELQLERESENFQLSFSSLTSRLRLVSLHSMPPTPRTLPPFSRLLSPSKRSPLRTSFRPFSSSSPSSLRSYRRFGDPPPDPHSQREDFNARASANGPVNPWEIIKKLPTSSGRNSQGTSLASSTWTMS